MAVPDPKSKPKSKQGRYTPPPAKKAAPSPTWYTVLVIACFAVGVVIIIVNYIAISSPSNVYLGVGLGLVLVGFLLSMRLR